VHGRDQLVAPAHFRAGQGSAIGENEQDKHDREQPTGNGEQPAHIGSDVGKFLLASQLNSAGRRCCHAPARASGRGEERSFSWGVLCVNRRGRPG